MENKFPPELIEKAKGAKSEAELLTLATENGIELTEEQARVYFEQLHKSGELSDEELDNVAGGGCYRSDGNLMVSAVYSCEHFCCKICGWRGTTHHTHFVAMYPNGVEASPTCMYCKYAKSASTICTNPLNNKNNK